MEGVSLHSCCVESRKWWDPSGISSSNAVVFIANHIHIVFEWGSQGSPLKIAVEVSYVKSMGTKVMIQHF